MEFKVAHPEHGQPFTPELTVIMDAPSRFVVGWSVAYAESMLAVSDALRDGMVKHGIPAMYYSDNGSGQTNKALDAPLTGILPRVGTHHETGIAGNPQGLLSGLTVSYRAGLHSSLILSGVKGRMMKRCVKICMP
jgi:putative transposase